MRATEIERTKKDKQFVKKGPHVAALEAEWRESVKEDVARMGVKCCSMTGVVDNIRISAYLTPTVSFLRSSLLAIIVSLLALTAYGFDMFGDCCGHRQQVQSEHCKTPADNTAPCKDDNCQCVCHGIISPFDGGLLRATDVAFVITELVRHADEIPPDAVPLGIDHPPQLS